MTGRGTTPVCGSRGIFTPDERHTTHAGAVQSSNLASKHPHWLAKMSGCVPGGTLQTGRFSKPVHGAQQDGTLVAHRRKRLERQRPKLATQLLHRSLHSGPFELRQQFTENLALDAHG